MTDIVERLLAAAGVPTVYEPVMQEAVAEIERLWAERLHWDHQNGLLEAEIERLRRVCKHEAGVELSEENDRLIAEIERLRAENERLKEWCRKLIEAGDFSECSHEHA